MMTIEEAPCLVCGAAPGHDAGCPVGLEAAIVTAVERSKAEITADIAAGKVDEDVASFSELHEYVDANEYGGLCDDAPWIGADGWTTDETRDAAEEVQNRVHAWLAAGRAAEGGSR